MKWKGICRSTEEVISSIKTYVPLDVPLVEPVGLTNTASHWLNQWGPTHMLKIKKNILLAPYTTYKIGGPAKYFVEAKTEEEILEALTWAQKNDVPYFVLGGGSNLLISDAGYDGLVIHLANKNYKFDGDRLVADAGCEVKTLVEDSVERGLDGFQWAGGLPGQLGGAIRGNANCFGGHTEDIIYSARAVTPKGKIKIFSNKQCKFGHKTSLFKQKPGYIILSAEIRLKHGDKKVIEEKMNYCVNWRAENQPKKEGTCGSVFTRVRLSDLPKGFFDRHPETKEAVKGLQRQKFSELGTGYLIDSLALKGKMIGGAQVSHKHANFIVNTANATAEHILIMNSLIKSRVLNEYGVILEEEVHYLE